FEELKKYSKLLRYETMVKAVEKPLYFCKEEVRNLIPSISMGTDGPVLTNVILITDNIIIDIKLQTKEETFDYVALNTIKNYRFHLFEHTIKGTDDKDIIYQVATIDLLHNPPHAFKTALNYVGDDRESWLKLVTEAIPIAILL
ncbi:MAG: hypothetical protein WAK96_07745, partial [Desulfobaccales bacterium]